MEQHNVQNNDEVEIDLLEVFYVLLDKIWAIILSGVLAALSLHSMNLLPRCMCSASRTAIL